MSPSIDDRTAERRKLLEDALVDHTLEDRVEMVVSSPAPDTFRAASAHGSVVFRREVDGQKHSYRRVDGGGVDPLADQASDRFLGHNVERATRYPSRTENSYPYAFDSIAQFFDSPHAPDLIALHAAAHTVDGHLGQHGSLGAVQARAPFIASGAGVRPLGTIEGSTRVVNVAPTVAALLGVDPHPRGTGPTGARRAGALLARQDGDVESQILDGSTASHVVVFLLDGCNANLLTSVVEAGEAPHIADLIDSGATFGHGSMASLPTATLANHTTAVTGAHPGHSGVPHNAWVVRGSDENIDLLEFEQMFWAMRHLSPDVETLFDALQRTRPGSFSSASFEFCDTGAAFSSFGLVRGGDQSGLPPVEVIRHLDRDAAASDSYLFMSKVDHLSISHTVDCWDRVHGNELPSLSWCSLALTDEAGHESGPHGELARAAVRDSDPRIGEVLAAVDRAGVRDDTAVLVIADHGMEQSDPGVDETWDAALADTGVPHREVGGGLIYVQ